MKTGIELIADERKRQIEVEGWDAEHDSEHTAGELALAAVCYATPILLYQQEEVANGIIYQDPWPWSEEWDKRPHRGNEVTPNNRVRKAERLRHLAKAGALIAAEIDRLLRGGVGDERKG